MERSVYGDGPAVARLYGEVYLCGVERVGLYGDVHVGDVAARAQQLLVAHDELRVEGIARAEEQVAADDPLAGQHVGVVAGAFEPVAVFVEDL